MSLLFCVFLFGVCSYLEDPPPSCAVFLALSVFRNIAELIIHDASLWLEAARDEDETIVDDCYEAATDASDYAGGLSEGDNHHVEHNPTEICDDQPGSEVVYVGEDGAARSYFGVTNKSMRACSYFDCVFLNGGGGAVNGRGVFRHPEGRAFYGEQVKDKRHGLSCSINKLHQMLIEQYEHGQLKSKMKWKIDQEHLRCAHCNCLYMEATNKLECRYHPDGVDSEDRFTCCGALQKHNPQGCAVDYTKTQRQSEQLPFPIRFRLRGSSVRGGIRR